MHTGCDRCRRCDRQHRRDGPRVPRAVPARPARPVQPPAPASQARTGVPRLDRRRQVQPVPRRSRPDQQRELPQARQAARALGASGHTGATGHAAESGHPGGIGATGPAGATGGAGRDRRQQVHRVRQAPPVRPAQAGRDRCKSPAGPRGATGAAGATGHTPAGGNGHRPVATGHDRRRRMQRARSGSTATPALTGAHRSKATGSEGPHIRPAWVRVRRRTAGMARRQTTGSPRAEGPIATPEAADHPNGGARRSPPDRDAAAAWDDLRDGRAENLGLRRRGAKRRRSRRASGVETR